MTDRARLENAVRNSFPISLKLISFNREQHAALDGILEVFLAELGHERIFEALSYCTKELVANAYKANVKRVFFRERHLDITNAEDYEEGIKDFRAYLTQDGAQHARKLRESALSISVTFHASVGYFTITVRNNVEMTEAEQRRIFERIIRARAYSSFYEALSTVLDSTEGAGLGILILLQSLERIGLDEDAFSITSESGQTVAMVTIPVSRVRLDKINALAQAIVRDVDSLPHFPENIVALLGMTADPDVQMNDIARLIIADPALTADLLKLVNSAHFMLPTRVTNILQALTLVGMKGLRTILYSYGTQKILGEKYSEMKELWEHSYRTALYAYILARSLKHLHDHLDDIYAAGILHDLGLIVVSGLHPDLQEKIRRFCRDKDIPIKLLENFSYGLNHADIGGLIATKWNFPPELIEGVRYHHEPLRSSAEHKNIVFAVYLANALCDIERGNLSFEQIETPVLRDFGIVAEQQLSRIHAKLREVYERQSKRT